jgi:hypothetical protein
MKALYETAFKFILKFLGNVTAGQWNTVKDLVSKAATDFAHLPGDQRRAWAVAEVKKLWSDLAPFIVNLLVDGAFGLLRNAGKV